MAILLHFFFMSSFSWMLMEGTLLYFQSVRAVKSQANFHAVISFGWLMPVINVSISLLANFNGYGTTTGCWLSIEKGFIWAFIGPALGIILVNLVLLGSVVRVFLKLKSNSQKSDWLKLRRCAKAIGLLTPLMGLSWLFGVLAFNDATKWFSYVFVLTNSFQGLVIFVLHCARNDDVQKALMKKFKKSNSKLHQYLSNTNSSSVSPSNGESSFTRISSVY